MSRSLSRFKISFRRFTSTILSLMLIAIIVIASGSLLNSCKGKSVDSAIIAKKSADKFTTEAPVGVSRDTWDKIPSSPGHKLHVTDLDLLCTDCHVSTDFTTRPGSFRCNQCHEKQVSITKFEQNHCTACHAFKSESWRTSELPPSTTCQTCHDDAVQKHINTAFFTTTGGMSLPCQDCHKPHKKGYVLEANSCLSCHAPYKSGKSRKAGHADCLQCHSPHLWTATKSTEFCKSCHSQTSAVIEHRIPFHTKDCTSCHDVHLQDNLKTGNCVNCHNEGWKFATSDVPERHKDCMICHSTTDWSTGGEGKCMSCHAGKIYGMKSAPVSVPNEHRECSNCHKPHTWYTSKETTNCSSCHQAIAKQTMIHKKKDCTICHTPHNPSFKGFETCTLCHHNPTKNSKYISVKSNCALCHQPHTWKVLYPTNTDGDIAKILGVKTDEYKANKEKGIKFELTKEQKDALHSVRASRFCGGCHSEVRDAGIATNRELKSDCSLCHVDHKWKPNDDLCTACHGSVVEESSIDIKHDCSICHANHKWSPLMPGDCSACHAAQTETGTASKNKVKANCSLCHVPHTWKYALECLMCHSNVSDQLIDTQHTSCDYCHADHKWKPTFDTACVMCHSDIVNESKTSGMVDCSMCHTAHSFSTDSSEMTPCLACHADAKPANEDSIKNNCSMCHTSHTWKADSENCSTCHSEQKNKGLHEIESHQSCNICHSNHKWKNVSEESCSMCHSDKLENHHPERTCIECHWFKQ